MQKKTPEEQAAREQAILGATEEATRVPLGVLERSVAVLELARTVAAKGLQSSLSDAGVAALTAHACAEGAYYNVMINLKGLAASDFTRATRAAAGTSLEQSRGSARAVADQVTQTLAG